MLVMSHQTRVQAEMSEEFSGVPGVFGRHKVDLTQETDGSGREVLKVPDRGA